MPILISGNAMARPIEEKRIIEDLRNYSDGSIMFRSQIPEYADVEYLGDKDGWRHFYGNLNEELQANMPTPSGREIRISCFVNANLFYCQLTGRECTKP